MNRKNIKRPESLLLEKSDFDYDSSVSLDSENLSKDSENFNVAFKNSFTLRTLKPEERKKPANLRIVNVKPLSPASPGYLENITQNEKRFYEWTRLEVHNWIINLADLNRLGKCQEIARLLLDHNITGDILPYLNNQHFNDMKIRELKTKLILKKNIDLLISSTIQELPEDEILEELLLSAGVINNASYSNYIPITERILSNLSDQIIKNYSVKPFSPAIGRTFGPELKSPTTEKNMERVESEMRKLQLNFTKLREDVTPVMKQLSRSKAPTPIESNYHLNHLTPGSVNGSPGINFPLKNTMSPTAKPFYQRNFTRQEGYEDIPTTLSTSSTPKYNYDNESQDGSVNLKFNRASGGLFSDDFPDDSTDDSDNNIIIGKYSSDYIDERKRSLMVNPFKFQREDKSPVDFTYEDATHSRLYSSASSLRASITGSQTSLASTPSPTAPTSAYQKSQNGFKSPSSTTLPPLSHLSSNILLQNSTAFETGSAPGSASNSHFNSPTSGKSEPWKQLKAKYDDPCYKVLQKAMLKHRIANNDWRNYVLVICHNDKERILGSDEKPVKVFKDLQDKGLHPSFLIRQLEEKQRSSNPQIPWDKDFS